MKTIRIILIAIFVTALFLTFALSKDSIPPTKHMDGAVTYYNDDGTESHTDYPDGTKVTYNKDGSKTFTYSDGSKIIIDKDGNLTSYDKNGNKELSLKYNSYNKIYYSKEKDGTITYYVQVGSKFYKDRTKYPDGSVTTYHYDGTIKSRVDKDKNITLYDENGNVEDVFNYDNKKYLYYKENEDGSRTYYDNDMTGWPIPVFTEHPDGSVTYYNTIFSGVLGKKSHTEHPDGSVTYYGFDKKIYTKHPDGSITYYSYPTEKKNYTEHPNGNISWYDKNENLSHVTHPDGSVTYYKNGKEWYTEDAKGNKTFHYEEIGREKLPRYELKFWEDIPDSFLELGPDFGYGSKGDKGSGGNTAETGLFNTGFSETYTDEDGNEVHENTDGSKMVVHKDGSVTYYNKNGKKTHTVGKDEIITYYDENGDVAHTINLKDNSITYYKNGKMWYTKYENGKTTYYYYEIYGERGVFVDEEFMNSKGFKGTAADMKGGTNTGDNDEEGSTGESGEDGYDETGLDMEIYNKLGEPGTGVDDGYEATDRGMGPDTNIIIDIGVDNGPHFLE